MRRRLEVLALKRQALGGARAARRDELAGLDRELAAIDREAAELEGALAALAALEPPAPGRPAPVR